MTKLDKNISERSLSSRPVNDMSIFITFDIFKQVLVQIYHQNHDIGIPPLFICILSRMWSIFPFSWQNMHRHLLKFYGATDIEISVLFNHNFSPI